MSTLHQDVPASALIAEGRCTPQCLIAADADLNGACRCRCRGTYHGSLGDAPITVRGTVPGLWWYDHRHGYSDEYLSSIPVIPPQRSAAYDAARSAARSLGVPYGGIQRRSGQGWCAEIDLRVTYSRGSLDWPAITDGTADLIELLFQGLYEMENASEYFPPPGDRWLLRGLASEEGARIVACALREALYENTAGLRRLVHGLLVDLNSEPCSCADCAYRAEKGAQR